MAGGGRSSCQRANLIGEPAGARKPEVAGDCAAQRQAERHHGRPEASAGSPAISAGSPRQARARIEPRPRKVVTVLNARMPPMSSDDSPQTAVQAVADGAAAQPAQPQVVAERVTDERCQRGLAVRQALAEIMQRQRIEQGQRAVAERRGDQGECERARWDRGQTGEQIGRAIRRPAPGGSPRWQGRTGAKLMTCGSQRRAAGRETARPPRHVSDPHRSASAPPNGSRGRDAAPDTERVLQPDSARRLAPAMIFSASAA